MRTSKKPRGNRSIYNACFEACEQRLLMSTYTVNTTSDAVNPGTGLLTLRQAIADANASTANDIVNFSPTAFKTGSVHTITLTQGQLSMIGTTTIDGPSSGNVTIDANHASRAFQISQGSLITIENLTITNGLIAPAAGQPAYGGAITNAGYLELDTVQVTNSNAAGGSYAQNPTGEVTGIGGASAGGAVYSTGQLVINYSKISGNTAQGGNSYGEDLGGTTPTNTAQGGAIYSSGPLSISGSTINQNSAIGGGDRSSSATGASFGGAVFDSGTLYLGGATFADNTSYGGSTINGFEVMNSAANGYGGALYLTNYSVLSSTLFNSNTVYGGDSGGGGGTAGIASGGAIYTSGATSADHLTIENNSAIGGGGPYNDNGPGGDAYGAGITSTASLNISSNVITNNIATGGFGEPISSFAPKSNAFGGGVYTTGSLNLVTSTISGNIAQADPNESGGQYAYGGNGGQAQGGGIFSNYSANITNSTISGNSALGGVGDPPYLEGTAGNGGNGQGGGIYNGGTLVITNSTLTTNNATGGEGGDGGEIGGSGGNGGNGIGGAIDSANALTTLYDTTISGNVSTAGTGGPAEQPNSTIYFNGDPGIAVGAGVSVSGSLLLAYNTILSGNTDSDSIADDIAGQLDTSSASNLIGTGGGLNNGYNGIIVGVNNPQLAPFGSYGGLTETLPPTSASPALNAGSNNNIPSGTTTDQRGDARITAGTVDIGSVELQIGSVTGTLFNDLNGDGIRQTGEPVLANVTVYADLSNTGSYKTGDPVTTTNSSGNYTLNGLPEGTIIIRQQPPSGYRQTYPDATAGEHVTVTPAGVSGALFADSTKLYVAGTVTLNGVGQSGVVVYADLNNDGKFESTENNKTTATDGSYAFVGLAAGTYTFRIVPPAGDTVTGNVATTVSLASGGVDGGVNFTLTKQAQTQLTGTIIGTPGSYGNDGNTIARAFDGNLSTFFDGPTANGNYAGLDLISPQVISSISFAPRSSYPARMVGGIFQASNSANFANAVNLYTITAAPAVALLTNIPITNTTAFRYVRYLSPNGSFGDVAEVQFFTPAVTPVTLSNGILTVNGTTAADTIAVNYGIDNDFVSQNVINVTINGITQVLDDQILHQVIINAGEGNNSVTVTSTEQNNQTTVPDIALIINSGAGNDTINVDTDVSDNTYIGNSITVNTGDGNNTVDLIYNGHATINGGSGNDYMTAQLGYGQGGANATMNGGDGDDTLVSGGSGYADVTANGQGGNDTFTNGDEDNRLYADGGTGSNTFQIINGPGFDFYPGPINLSSGTFPSGTLTNIQNVTGTSMGDLTVIGNDQNNVFKIASQDGEPLSLYGGGGNDTFYERDNQYTYIDGGTGTDTAYTDPTDTTVNVENLNPDQPAPVQFTGTPVGTAGSYQNDGNTIAKVFDGNLSTYFDAPTSTGGYVGLDLGSAQTVDLIRFAPRPGYESRMVGGEIQASNSPDFSNLAIIYTINFTPAANALTQVGLGYSNAYRYYRYVGPAGSFCNIAELQLLYTSPLQFVNGTPIGTAGSYHNLGNTITNVFDNNPATYFDGPDATGDWLGLDLGSTEYVTQVQFAPRPAYAGRMVGGQIQASNSANFSSGVVTLYTITATPADGTLTTQTLNNTTAFRYYRYIGPANSYCNIADLYFEG